ncbi:MAG: LysR family transcriptional regulator [Candidatus Rokubacteria bacterium]|nr:LysR family transcriptional regulator [Candidatus Rokubacteria bacterium]
MTLRQFEVFVAVARARSFRRGAESLHLTQPALSQHVKELEAELGTRLFDRLGRTVALTEAGRLLQEHALRLFATLQGARDAIGELQGLRRGSLLIGGSTTPGIYVLPRLIAAFQTRYPAIQVSLRIANSRVIEERVRANELDLGVVGGHVLGPGERCLTAGLLDELMLIVPPKHPWARRGSIPPGNLTGERLLMREEGSATRQVTERALGQAGIRFSVAMELDHTEAIKEAVMAGLGVAFVSVHAIRGELAARRLRTVRLRGVPIRRHFHVIHHEARVLAPAARAFVELLRMATEGPGAETGRVRSGGRRGEASLAQARADSRQ